jgi:hypothetical protein
MTAAYIAGHYQVTLGSAGIVGDTDGIWISWSPSIELIANTDSGGRTPIDGIYRGGNCFITINVLTTDPLALAAVTWPFSDTIGLVNNIGALAFDFSFGLDLKKFTGTNATPNELIALHVIPAPDAPIRVNLAPSLWRTTLRFQCLPYISSNNYVWFTTSTATVAQSLGSGYIAGACSVLWNTTLALGDTDLNSLQFEFMHHYEPIQGDSAGDTVVDMIYQGSSAYLNMVLLQANADGIAALWPYAAQGIVNTTAGLIGRLHTPATAIAKPLIITPYAGTPAALVLGSISSTYATLAPGFEVQGRLGPTLRKLPFRVIFFPDSGSLFTISPPA